MATVLDVSFPVIDGNRNGALVSLRVRVLENVPGGICSSHREFVASINRINCAFNLQQWQTYIDTVPANVFITGGSYELALGVAYLLARGYQLTYINNYLMIIDFARRRYDLARKLKLSVTASIIRAHRKTLRRHRIARANGHLIGATAMLLFEDDIKVAGVGMFEEKVEVLIKKAKITPAPGGSVFFYSTNNAEEPLLRRLKGFGVTCVPVTALRDVVRARMTGGSMKSINIIIKPGISLLRYLIQFGSNISALMARTINWARTQAEPMIWPANILLRFIVKVAGWLVRPAAVAASLFVSYMMLSLMSHYFFPTCDLYAPGQWRFMQQASLPTLVRSADISKCNAYLAAGDQDGVLRTWNLRTGELIWSHMGHDGPIEKVVFSRSLGVRLFGFRLFGGPALYTVGSDGFVKSWNVRTGEVDDSLARAGRPTAVAVSSDRRMIALAGADAAESNCRGSHAITFYLAFYDWRGRRRLRALPQHIATEESGSGCVDRLELSCDGRLVALAHEDKEIQVWESTTGNYVRTIEDIEQTPRFRFRCSEGHKNRLVTTGQFIGQDRITTYDLSTGSPKQSYGYGGDVFDAIYESSQGEMIVSGVDGTGDLVVADLPKGVRCTVFHAQLEPRVLGFSPDGNIMMSIVNTAGGQRLVLVDTKTGRPIRPMDGGGTCAAP